MRNWKLILFVIGISAICSVSFGQFWYWPNGGYGFYGTDGYYNNGYNTGNCPNGQCNRQNNSVKEETGKETKEPAEQKQSQSVEPKQSQPTVSEPELTDDGADIAPIDSPVQQVSEQNAELESSELDFELFVSNAELSLINEINKMRTEAGLPRLWIRYPQCKKIRGCCDKINEGEVVPTDGEVECVCFELLTPKQIVEKWCSDLKNKKALMSEDIAEIAVGQSGKCSMVRVW